MAIGGRGGKVEVEKEDLLEFEWSTRVGIDPSNEVASPGFAIVVVEL